MQERKESIATNDCNPINRLVSYHAASCIEEDTVDRIDLLDLQLQKASSARRWS
jgi:hypothetical protein